MMNASTRADFAELLEKFERDYGVKYSKAVRSLVTDSKPLTTFFDFPAEHWRQVRTTNPIESTFATVRLRQRATKGGGSRKASLAMTSQLLLLAQNSWRRLNRPGLLPLVRASAVFADGVRVQRTEMKTGVTSAKARKGINARTNEVAA